MRETERLLLRLNREDDGSDVLEAFAGPEAIRISLIHPDNVQPVRRAERIDERCERDVMFRAHPTRLYSLSTSAVTCESQPIEK